MKKLSILALAILSSMPAFAITRTVVCKDNSGADGSPLVIQLRGGNAQIYICGDTECPADAEPAEVAVLTNSGSSSNTLEYRVISGRGPAQSRFAITFPEGEGYPSLALDGSDSYMSCY